jgi:signal transduction histidine kinase
MMLGPVTVQQPPSPPHQWAERPSRVLIVEDDPLFRKFSLAALNGARHFRFEADTAASWGEASRRLGEATYDCVLLDLGLPDCEGIATVRAALAAAPTVPIVVLTGEEDPAIAESALREGAQDFVEKVHADPGILERAIRHAVERGRWTVEMAAKNRELETRNAELDDFAHAVSHDLKAPLRASYYLVHEAEIHLKAGAGDAAREALDGVGPRIQRLFNMIDGVLTLTQAGRAAREPAQVDVGQLVEEIVESLTVPPGFEVRIAAGMPTLLTQQAALTQVFQNLIENAIKHHPGEGGHVEVGWSEAGPFHEFTVADDGPGIPPAVRERAFRLFQTLGRESGGTGIGLALVRKVVEANGGAIRIEDGDGGRGVRFRFTWPSAPRS